MEPPASGGARGLLASTVALPLQYKKELGLPARAQAPVSASAPAVGLRMYDVSYYVQLRYLGKRKKIRFLQ